MIAINTEMVSINNKEAVQRGSNLLKDELSLSIKLVLDFEVSISSCFIQEVFQLLLKFKWGL